LENSNEEIDKIYFSNEVTLYPNPNNGRFEVAFSDGDVKFSKIFIFDMSGIIVFEIHDITKNTVPIDICHLQKGTYIVQIIHNDNTHSKRIVVN